MSATDRDTLIARILEVRPGHDCPHVLAALPTWTLERMSDPSLVDLGKDAAAYPDALRENLRVGASMDLPGETGGHSVYRLTFPDGAYVGMTGQSIFRRIEQHFGVAGPHGTDRMPGIPIDKRIGTLRIVARLAAGMPCTAECLHSGLSRDEARALEAAAIARQGGQLGDPPYDPSRGAVARYYANKPPSKSLQTLLSRVRNLPRRAR